MDGLEIFFYDVAMVLAGLLKLPFDALVGFFGTFGVTMLGFSLTTVILIHPWWLVLLIGLVWVAVVRHIVMKRRQLALQILTA